MFAAAIALLVLLVIVFELIPEDFEETGEVVGMVSETF
jgi:hypothetical protein